jgi:hypothetical protein
MTQLNSIDKLIAAMCSLSVILFLLHQATYFLLVSTIILPILQLIKKAMRSKAIGQETNYQKAKEKKYQSICTLLVR